MQSTLIPKHPSTLLAEQEEAGAGMFVCHSFEFRVSGCGLRVSVFSSQAEGVSLAVIGAEDGGIGVKVQAWCRLSGLDAGRGRFSRWCSFHES